MFSLTNVLWSFGWHWALVPVAAWFLRGVYVASTRPRFRYHSHSVVWGADKKVLGFLLTVHRQELLPPWRSLVETWRIDRAQDGRSVYVTREGDGAYYRGYRYSDGKEMYDEVAHRLHGILNVALMRDAETEHLTETPGGTS